MVWKSESNKMNKVWTTKCWNQEIFRLKFAMTWYCVNNFDNYVWLNGPNSIINCCLWSKSKQASLIATTTKSCKKFTEHKQNTLSPALIWLLSSFSMCASKMLRLLFSPCYCRNWSLAVILSLPLSKWKVYFLFLHFSHFCQKWQIGGNVAKRLATTHPACWRSHISKKSCCS